MIFAEGHLSEFFKSPRGGFLENGFRGTSTAEWISESVTPQTYELKGFSTVVAKNYGADENVCEQAKAQLIGILYANMEKSEGIILKFRKKYDKIKADKK